MTSATVERRIPIALAPVESVTATAYEVPLPEPESDGTLEWDATTIVVAEVRAGTTTGLGYTYAPPSTAAVIANTLAAVVVGRDASATASTWSAMVHAIRNQGRPGIVGMAISAVDVALWDLKARLLGVSVADLAGRGREAVPAYGSGGFTSLTSQQLSSQLAGFAELGLPAVKMKVGRDPSADPSRVHTARSAIGEEIALFVDANGAYTVKQALDLALAFADQGVSWFEEPVSSDDPLGLHRVREGVPPGMEVAAGEYGYALPSFRQLLDAGAVDCLQADVTRCGGITSFLRVAALAAAHQIDISTHTAPQVSAHAAAACSNARHIEYFVDHVGVESLLFDGVLEPAGGGLRPDSSRAGLGIELKHADADRYRR